LISIDICIDLKQIAGREGVWMRKVLEVVGLGLLAALGWISYQAVYGPNPLPQRIPTHFNVAGQADGWGSPSALWLLPAVAVGLYVLISVVASFPAAFNYPVRVTAASRARLEGLTLRMISWIKVELAGLFLFIQWSIIQSVRMGHGALSVWIVPVFLGLVFATIAIHAIAVYRAARVVR
jgi:uncharacterized membrane protein